MMFTAAIPVDAVTEMMRWARMAHRMTSLIRTDFPVPDGSLINETGTNAPQMGPTCWSGEEDILSLDDFGQNQLLFRRQL